MELGWPITVMGVCKSLFYTISIAALGNLSAPETRAIDVGAAVSRRR